jgi:hypothetical protein
MTKLLLTLVLAFAAFAAQAQIKCWTDANGKRACGDAPPPGAKVTTINAPAASEPKPATEDAGKDAKKRGPQSPAEREQEYRKRQAETQKATAKADEERKDADAKRENCDRARESVRTLEAGGRISRVDSKGERFFLEDAQIAQELAQARQQAQQWCN